MDIKDQNTGPKSAVEGTNSGEGNLESLASPSKKQLDLKFTSESSR